MLRQYIYLWAIGNLSRVLSLPGVELVGNGAVALTSALALASPLNAAVLLLAFGTRVACMIASMPFLHDSQHWCMMTDIVVGAELLRTLRVRLEQLRSSKGRRKGGIGGALLGPLSLTEADAVTAACAGTIRYQMIVLYAAAAWWKFNEGFMNPRTSSAPLLIVQILEEYLPTAFLENGLSARALRLVVSSAPLLTLILEAVIPVLLATHAAAGVCLTCVFHWVLAITPPPNNNSAFGTQTLPRLIFFLDPSSSAQTMDAAVRVGTRTAATVWAVAAATTAIHPLTRQGATSIYSNVPTCAGLAALLCVAAAGGGWRAERRSVGPASRSSASSIRAVDIVMRVYTVYYAFVAIPLGTMDMGSPNMFSSLRIHAGSNHFVRILPLGLMQQLFCESNPRSSILADIFGGGIVRVDRTSSSHLVGPLGVDFPGEYTTHKPRLVHLLVAAGHCGRQFNAMGGYTKVGNHPPSDNAIDATSSPNGGYTIPSMELRRLIRDAQQRFPRESFFIEGAILPGCEGDEIWRATASVARFRLIRDGDDGSLSCFEEGAEGGGCSERTRAALLAPPSGHWLSRLLMKFLLQQPYPIVPENTGRDRSVVCFGP